MEECNLLRCEKLNEARVKNFCKHVWFKHIIFLLHLSYIIFFCEISMRIDCSVLFLSIICFIPIFKHIIFLLHLSYMFSIFLIYFFSKITMKDRYKTWNVVILLNISARLALLFLALKVTLWIKLKIKALNLKLFGIYYFFQLNYHF
jgi:hypothetical protein